jgi:hypothetical protein
MDTNKKIIIAAGAVAASFIGGAISTIKFMNWAQDESHKKWVAERDAIDARFEKEFEDRLRGY